MKRHVDTLLRLVMQFAAIALLVKLGLSFELGGTLRSDPWEEWIALALVPLLIRGSLPPTRADLDS